MESVIWIVCFEDKPRIEIPLCAFTNSKDAKEYADKLSAAEGSGEPKYYFKPLTLHGDI